MRSTAEDLLLWEQRINERILSRMTIEDWCKKNGISKHKYHYWNHHIREKQKSNKEETFAEITPILSNNEVRDITRRQLEWLLEGLQIDQKKAHPDNIDTSGMTF